MTDTTLITFTIHAIPSDVLDEVRSSGVGEAGVRAVNICSGGGEPLRCCLRDAGFGEDLLLFGYSPPLPASPYRETGAVYVHRDTCAGAENQHAYPQDWHGRAQVLRAYDGRGWIHGASRVHDGSDPAGEIARVLAEPGVVEVHSRNVVHGCFMFVAKR